MNNFNSRGKDNLSWDQEPLVQAVRDGPNAILPLIGDDSSKINEVHPNGFTLLQIAIYEGNKDIVKFLLDRVARVPFRNRDFNSLHLAAREGHEDILKLLMDQGTCPETSVDYKDCQVTGNTLLHSAVIGQKRSTVKFLLDLGADINATNKARKSALLMAIQTQQEDLVRLLLDRGCRLDWNDVGNTLLHEAAKIPNKKIIDLLLDKFKFNLDARNWSGQTALHVACDSGHEDIVRILIERGAQVKLVDKNGRTLLHCAITSGKVELLRLTMNHGIDVDTRAQNNETPLHVACRQGKEEMMRVLLESGARVNGWSTPLWYPTRLPENIKVISLLLDYGYDMSVLTSQYKGPFLRKIYQMGNTETVKILIERGADVNSLDKDSETLLFKVVRQRDMDMLEFLIKNGCDVNKRNSEGQTVLHAAIISGKANEELVGRLIESGAEIDAENAGHTLLSLACLYKHETTVQLLLESGANVEAKNHSNENIVEQVFRFIRCGRRPAEILVQHLVRMKYRKMPVSEEIWKTIEGNDEMGAYRVKCESELESMRSDDSELSFWGLLLSSDRCLMGFARNEKMVARVLGSDECVIKFPIYSSSLTNQMKKGLRRKILLDKVQYFFKAVAESEGNEHLPKLPVLCVQEIFSYFRNRDFKNLIQVCDPCVDLHEIENY